VIVWINGPFGVGKTTLTKELCRRDPKARAFDPERIGWVLQRTVGLLRPGDYQDLPAWRRLSVRGIRLARRRRETVIVPMAFTNLAYLRELQDGARTADQDVRHFCLTAPYEVVRARLAPRGYNAWVLRRAAECCLAHGRPEFDERIPTEVHSAEAVAAEIARRLAGGVLRA
jgi:hypothetical protein